ncbi:murein DD-endopeptidase MepM [Limnobaculum parvum]|uniref:Murein DD-endopeptidase MepM n=1 Tax=Limnobaculum parvum TaxID=2172103 RepID=A0A2Y9TUV9_9GAMM|nr:murein DD-endopeptidase MepM [Limnobaculum parvum]AWH87465.1 murein DD-endopeptidase MepM [Limnobaculum parvum]
MLQVVRTIALFYNNLPRPHKFTFGALLLLTWSMLVWQAAVYKPITESPLPLPTIPTTTATDSSTSTDVDDTEPMDQPTPDDEIPKDELDDTTGDASTPNEYVVSNGDTLGSILTQFGMDASDIYLLADKNSALANLKIGQQLSWVLDDDDVLQSLTWVVSRRETRVYERAENGFKETINTLKGEWKNSIVTGKMDGSFLVSARAAGLTNSEIRAVTKALQWQLDLRKLRNGDRFSVLLSREVLDGKNEQSQLIGVRMQSSGKDYYAIRSGDGKFYDREGSGLAKGFMRYPTPKQYKVTSPFNPRRLHPITGRVAPHKGVDFSMPIGSPVLAVGDGEVVVAKFSGAAGNYVAIRHGRQYSTRYMHLNKILVRPGQKVKRGDRIALSGNTGRSTGPHLHYELWVNELAVNPLTATLPRSDSLIGQDRAEYLAQVKEVVPQLHL